MVVLGAQVHREIVARCCRRMTFDEVRLFVSWERCIPRLCKVVNLYLCYKHPHSRVSPIRDIFS